MEIVSLKCDYCFKEWFSNETIRKYFISDVLDIPVENIRSVRIANPFCETLPGAETGYFRLQFDRR